MFLHISSSLDTLYIASICLTLIQVFVRCSWDVLGTSWGSFGVLLVFVGTPCELLRTVLEPLLDVCCLLLVTLGLWEDLGGSSGGFGIHFWSILASQSGCRSWPQGVLCMYTCVLCIYVYTFFFVVCIYIYICIYCIYICVSLSLSLSIYIYIYV